MRGPLWGVAHPGLICTDHDLDILDGRAARNPLREVDGYENGWGVPALADQAAIVALMRAASHGESGPASTTAG
jgi:hypothetical protein